MKRPWSTRIFTACVLLLGAAPLRAEDLPVTTGRAGSVLCESAALLVILAVLLVSAKVYLALRGGKVGKSWLWVLSGFGVWGLGQVIFFCGELGVMPRIGFWTDAIQVSALVLLFVGITRFRKLFA